MIVQAQTEARLEAMARAAANALTGVRLDWDSLPAATRRVFLEVVLAVHLADQIELVMEPA